MTRPDELSTTAIQPRTTVIDGFRIRYALDQKLGADCLLLLSPWPESIYAYLPIWPQLAARYSLLAINLPGFGASEGRAELLTPRSMGTFLLRILDEFGVERVHAFGLDLGPTRCSGRLPWIPNPSSVFRWEPGPQHFS